MDYKMMGVRHPLEKTQHTVIHDAPAETSRVEIEIVFSVDGDRKTLVSLIAGRWALALQPVKTRPKDGARLSAACAPKTTNDARGNGDGAAFRAGLVAADPTPSKRLTHLSGFRSNTHRPLAEANVRFMDIRNAVFRPQATNIHSHWGRDRPAYRSGIDHGGTLPTADHGALFPPGQTRWFDRLSVFRGFGFSTVSNGQGNRTAKPKDTIRFLAFVGRLSVAKTMRASACPIRPKRCRSR
jgi:hypothetical protein